MSKKSAALTDHGETNPLLRILGVGFGLAVVLGGVIGQGILRTPGIVAGSLGDYWLIMAAWFFAGVLTMIDALSISELSASMPMSGGPYAFVRRAFGSLAGFVTGWTDWLAQTATASFIAVVFGECLARIGVRLTGAAGTDGILLIVILMLFHFLGTRSSGLSQQVGSAIKALVLLGVTIILFGSNPVAEPQAMSVPVTLIGAIAAFRAVYATYGGWNAAAYFCEEVENPGRSLPRAILGGIAIVTVLYCIINAALLHVLPPMEAARSSLPVADAATAAMGASGGWTVALVATVIVLTVENTQLMFTPRVLHGMARDQAVPAILASVTKTGVPIAALIMTCALAIALTSSGAYDALLAIYAPLSVTTNALVNMAAIRMRFKEPSLPRPFRMPLFPLPSLIALAVNLGLAVAFVLSDLAHTRYALLLVVSGLPLYFWCASRKASAGYRAA